MEMHVIKTITNLHAYSCYSRWCN